MSDESNRPKALQVKTDNIPDTLRELRRWVNWRYEEKIAKDGEVEFTKIPKNSRRGYNASSTDPATWSTFDVAASALGAGNYDGIGFVLNRAGDDDGILAIDLDHCRKGDGAVEEWARGIVKQINSYTEVSPSGAGLRILLMGKLPAKGRKKGNFECYERGRYVTITGHKLESSPATVENRQAELDVIHAEVFGGDKDRQTATPLLGGDLGDVPNWVDDGEIIRRAESAANGARFKKLWSGDTSDCGNDHSKADAALCEMLAFWTGGNHEWVERLFCQSGLVRPKWTDRADYRDRTIELALSGKSSFYDWSEKFQPATAAESAAIDAMVAGDAAPAPDADEKPNGPKDPGPFPKELLTVPGFVGDLAGHMVATAYRPQPVISLAAALCTIATLAGRRIKDEHGTRCNFYAFCTVGTGMGKDHPRQLVKELFFQAGKPDLAAESVASHAGLISRVAKDPAVLFLMDEVGRMLKTVGEPGSSPHLFHIVTKLLQLYTSAGTAYKGDSYADTSRDQVIYKPCASVFGTTVEDSFFSSLSLESVTDGLLARVFVFEGDETAEKMRPKEVALPRPLIDTTKAWIASNPPGNPLNSELPEEFVIPSTDAAESILSNFDLNEAETERKLLGKPYGSLWTRAGEKANKLALLFAASRGIHGITIDEGAATWGCEVSRYLTKRLAFICDKHVSENYYDSKRKKIIRIIGDAGPNGIDGHALCSKTKSMPPKERQDLIDSVLMTGEVKVTDVATGGRPKRIYVLAR